MDNEYNKYDEVNHINVVLTLIKNQYRKAHHILGPTKAKTDILRPLQVLHRFI